MSAKARVLLVLTLGVAGAALLRLGIGHGDFRLTGVDSAIMQIRVTRVVACLVVGSALAGGGTLLQTLVRNPLASPDLLGLTAGAGLGATLSAALAAAALGAGGSAGLWAVDSVAAVAGALIVMAIVYTLSQRRGFVEPTSLILVGVMLTIICGALTMLVQHLVPSLRYAGLTLLIGSIDDGVSAARLGAVGGMTLVLLIVSVLAGGALDAATLGEDEARSVGVPIGVLRVAVFFAVGLMTAGSVLIAGQIGFVGLVCPHMARRLVGPGHRASIVASALLGVIVLLVGDSVVRAVWLDSGRLPLGVVTALLGAPVFIWMLRSLRDGGIGGH